MTTRHTRRQFVATVAAGAIAGVGGCGASSSGDGTGQQEPTPVDGETTTVAGPGLPDAVALESLSTALEAPLDVAFAPAAGYRYVAQQNGVVRRHGPDGLAAEPFLDLRGAVSAGGEKGLLGLALHPEFEQNRRLFVRYSADDRPGLPADYSHTFVLAEFEATADGRRVRRESQRTVLEIPQPQSNHNAGSIAFGPEGYLYVGVGDGGAGGDQGRGHVEDWYGAVAGGNGQDVTENLLGSILRIDVDCGTDDQAYGVPSDNPLVDRAGLDEQYAWGLRNPWRFSFDGEELFVGDVGQNRYEEVDLVEKGGNYGWNVREGRHCFQQSSCPDRTPDSVRDGEPLREPIVEYPHSGQPVSGRSVIGGAVYRGTALPGLAGRYVFGDFFANGRLFVATRPTSGDRWPTTTLPVVQSDRGKLGRLRSFGRDTEGELYVLTNGGSETGFHRIVPA